DRSAKTIRSPATSRVFSLQEYSKEVRLPQLSVRSSNPVEPLTEQPELNRAANRSLAAGGHIIVDAKAKAEVELKLLQWPNVRAAVLIIIGLIAVPTAIFAQTDEIQVYDADIEPPG